MKTSLLLPKLFVATCILMLVACNTSASDTKNLETSQSENIDPENVESVQMPEKENWKTFEDRRSGITFSHPADWKVIIEDDIVIFEALFLTSWNFKLAVFSSNAGKLSSLAHFFSEASAAQEMSDLSFSFSAL